jgi:hypothetical protein
LGSTVITRVEGPESGGLFARGDTRVAFVATFSDGFAHSSNVRRHKRIHTYTHTHMHTRTHTYTNTQTHKHTNTQTHKHTHTLIFLPPLILQDGGRLRIHRAVA